MVARRAQTSRLEFPGEGLAPPNVQPSFFLSTSCFLRVFGELSGETVSWAPLLEGQRETKWRKPKGNQRETEGKPKGNRRDTNEIKQNLVLVGVDWFERCSRKVKDDYSSTWTS